MIQTSLILGDSTPLRSGMNALKQNLSSMRQDSSSNTTARTPQQPHTPLQNIKSSNKNYLVSADYALSAPSFWQKCDELSYLLASCPQKDLAKVFITIVERIFSLSTPCSKGWALGNMLKSSSPRDFNAVYYFLSSKGPLLDACYSLLSDSYLRYDFPVSLLSQTTQQQIEAGNPSQFIALKICPQNPRMLQLNSFEYYMFTFAAYLIQPYTMDNKFIPGESLYPILVEDYFSYFLPCDGSTPPGLPFSLTVSSAPMTESPLKPVQTTPSRKSLLKHSGPASPQPLMKCPPTATNVVTSPTGHEIWRSETVINTFGEMWLSPLTPLPRDRCGSPSLSQATSDLVIPVSDTLRIVRMMIKHIHYFANSGGPQDIIPLDQLKRCVLPSIKKQLYLVFKYILAHWPHDTSFRLVLETWLSYIQPWRYTDAATIGRGSDDVSSSMVVDAKWQTFVAENIVFYSNILRMLLPRFFRMDLTSSKNAYMLFRVSKIYSQKGLVSLMKNGEAGLDRGSRGYIPGLLDKLNVSDSVMAAARQCVADLEDSGTHEAIFGNQFRQTVAELLSLAARAQEVSQDSLNHLNKNNKQDSAGLFWFMESLFGSGETEPVQPELDEHKKCVNYLSQSTSALSMVFDIKVPDAKLAQNRYTAGGSGVNVSPGEPEKCIKTGQGRVLTPHGRWQLLNGIAKSDIRYERDPDLTPITESEVAWIVRVLYAASQWINEKYGHDLKEMYGSIGIVGEASRMLLAEPTEYVELEKTIDGSPAKRVLKTHPPRVSLRVFANKQIIMYLLLTIFLISFLFNCNFFTAIILLAIGTIFLTMIVASFRSLNSSHGKHFLNETLDCSKDN